MRMIATGGVLKQYLKELEQEPEDLISQDDDDLFVDEGTLSFSCYRHEKQYQL
jgi:hypothetical protein